MNFFLWHFYKKKVISFSVFFILFLLFLGFIEFSFQKFILRSVQKHKNFHEFSPSLPPLEIPLKTLFEEVKNTEPTSSQKQGELL